MPHRLNNLGFNPWQEQEIFPFSKMFTLDWWPTNPVIQWALGGSISWGTSGQGVKLFTHLHTGLKL